MADPDTTATINRILLHTAITADPLVERSHDQKLERIAKIRAELHDLGYSIVTTEWLRIVFKQMTFEDMERIAREKAE